MDTFKAIMVPLAVLLLALAMLVPGRTSPPSRGWAVFRWVCVSVALVLAAIAIFLALDATA